MLACFVWTNSQIINTTNAVVNLYPDEKADLYIRMGEHMSAELVGAVKKSGVYENVFCFDPFHINYSKLSFGFIPHFRALFLKRAYRKAYSALLDRLCKGKVYDRVLLAWFYTENVFLLEYWAKSSPNMAITLVDEGTGSYCYHKKELLFPLSLIRSKKEKLKRFLTEGGLSRKFGRRIDSFAMYRPEYSRPDVDFERLRLPQIREESNPVLYRILCNAVGGLDYTHFIRYNKRDLIYFSTYSPEGINFDKKSLMIIEAMLKSDRGSNIIAKIHMGNSNHAQSFARSYEDRIFVDRAVYIFEGLYAQLNHPEDKVLVSCASTAAINPKFMFGIEPYVIFTFRLYDTYRQCGVERDDWIAQALFDSYEDKSRVMIPNSLSELKEMLNRVKAERMGVSIESLGISRTDSNLEDLEQLAAADFQANAEQHDSAESFQDRNNNEN